MYLIIKNGEAVECQTALELASCFDISINDNGRVFFEGRMDTISYNPEKWTKQEMLIDFVRTRLPKFKRIYKAERL